MPGLDAIVCGSVAVTRDGRRCGKGEGYSDLEFAILRELGHPPVPVATTVHDLQVVASVPRDPTDQPLSVIGCSAYFARPCPLAAMPLGWWDRAGVRALRAAAPLRSCLGLLSLTVTGIGSNPTVSDARLSNRTSLFMAHEISGTAAARVGRQRSQLAHSTVEDLALRCRRQQIDHPDRPETTEGHYADHNTDDIGPDQRREDEDQRAACTPRY